MATRTSCIAAACVVTLGFLVHASPIATAGEARAADRSTALFQARVESQLAVERYRFERRAAAVDMPAITATFEEAVPRADVELKVRDQLRLAVALERIWGRSLGEDELQGELDRILSHSNDRAGLAAIFARLDNDTARIADLIVEPILVSRLAHQLYWWDQAFHGKLRQQAESELAELRARGTSATFSGEVTETEWRLVDSAGFEPMSFEQGVQIRRVNEAEWQDVLGTLRNRWQVDAGPEASRLRAKSLPPGALSPLMEDKEYFWASRVVATGDDFVRVASFTWWKTSFSQWWEGVRESFPTTIEDVRHELRCAPLPSGPTVMAFATSPQTGTRAVESDAWYAIDSSDPECPTAREAHTAVWTGSQMIVWGGTNGTQYFSSGGVYDPATDSWSATSTGSGCPSARIEHGAVVPATNMFIWGGWNGTDIFGDGARYNPTTNGWTTLPTEDAPLARYGHSMKETSNGFYVWGGETDISKTATGASFTTVGSYWIPLNEPDPPVPRYHASIVRDPDSFRFAFLVWGGSSGTETFLDTGGAYSGGFDPGWEPTPADGAPSGRFSHTAVWCNNATCCSPEMIVWGGFTSTGYTNTGAILDYPGFSGTWSSLPTAGSLPAGRYRHTAVIDNQRASMIVWGGTTSGGETRAGGILDLCAESWTATNTADADTPSKRSGHSAVWTGSSMIVWGGVNGGTPLANGGIYTYCWDSPSGSASITVSDEDSCDATGVRISWSDMSISWGCYEVHPTVEIVRDSSTIATGLSLAAGSYLDTGATPNTTHSYQVVFSNSCGLTLTMAGEDGTDQASESPTVTAVCTAEDSDGCTANSGIDVSWPADPGGGWGDNGVGERKYRVWRWDNLSASWSALGSQITYGTTSYHDATTLTGFTYMYRVRYINGCGDTAETFATSTVFDRVGGSPSGTGAATADDAEYCGHTGNRVSWAQDPGDWGDWDEGDRFYRVQRSTNGVDFNPIGDNIAYPATTWVDANANPDQLYYYRVRYKNGCELTGDSANDTATDTANGAAPTVSVNSSSVDPSYCVDGGIQVTWSQDAASWGDGDTGTRSYDVLRNGVALAAATGLAYETTSFTDTTGVNGITYLYQVRYTNGCGLTATTSGTSSNDRPVTPDPPASNNSAEDVEDCAQTGVRVSWDADPDGYWGDSGGTHTYTVLRAGVAIQEGIPYGTTSFVDTSGTPGVEYLYTVRYVNCGGLYSETTGVNATDDGTVDGIFCDGFESGDASDWSTATP